MITASNVDTHIDTFAPYGIREIVHHLRDNLDVDLRWNGLFLCFEARLPYTGGDWIPASPNWQRDPIHQQVRDIINSHPRRRILGTWKGYDAMLRQIRRCPETQYHPLDDLAALAGAPGSFQAQLSAHITAVQKAYRSPYDCNHQRVLTIRHPMPLMPARWAHLESYVFHLQPITSVPPVWMNSVWRRSNLPGKRVIVLVGTPTLAQERSGYLAVQEPPDPEMAWQEAAWWAGMQRDRASVASVFSEAVATSIMDGWESTPNGYPLPDLVRRTGMVLSAQVDHWLDDEGRRVAESVGKLLTENGFSSRKSESWASLGLDRWLWNRDEDWDTAEVGR